MFADFMNWLANPLRDTSGGPSAWTLFLFVGLTLAILAAWALIFRHIKEAI